MVTSSTLVELWLHLNSQSVQRFFPSSFTSLWIFLSINCPAVVGQGCPAHALTSRPSGRSGTSIDPFALHVTLNITLFYARGFIVINQFWFREWSQITFYLHGQPITRKDESTCCRFQQAFYKRKSCSKKCQLNFFFIYIIIDATSDDVWKLMSLFK